MALASWLQMGVSEIGGTLLLLGSLLQGQPNYLGLNWGPLVFVNSPIVDRV